MAASENKLSALQSERMKRNEKIEAELKKGTPVSTIAEKVSLSVARIYEIAANLGVTVVRAPRTAKKSSKKAS